VPSASPGSQPIAAEAEETIAVAAITAAAAVISILMIVTPV